MKPFLEQLQERPLLFDGAMGTLLYERGVFVNACYDEVCLTRPELVREIHRAYLEAGADVIETNSFGANRFKLRPFGLAERAMEINAAAARLAREAAGTDALVAGAVGPCTHPEEALPPGRHAEVQDAFAEQLRALAQGGVDLLLLETFSKREELELGLAAAEGLGLPVVASFTVDEQGATAVGTSVEDLADALCAHPGVDAIGLNCGTGPAGAYEAAVRVLRRSRKPLVVMPNAGYPREVSGRLLYMTSPEYFTSYVKRLVKRGARGVGGCCGTRPEHIREAARALRSLSRGQRPLRVEPACGAPEVPEVEPVPVAERSRLAARLAEGALVTSVELLPPRSTDLTKLVAKARRCAAAGVDAINVPDGPRASPRVSPMIAALTIEREAGIETVLHYCCRDRNLIGMQSDLMGAHAAGLRNVLIVTGDPPKLGDYPDATGVFDVDSVGLTRVASGLNHGHDVGGSAVRPPTALHIGVGANPVAVDLDREVERYVRKVEAGAEFAITQPIFDPEALFRFLDRIAGRARPIPVIAGVWPLLSFRNAEFMANEIPEVVIPPALLERMRGCHTQEEGRAAGVAIAREIAAAIRPRVQGFQVSAPLGLVDLALAVLADVLPPRGA